MQHVIIGTAGHIDHGKTTLIKALTGRDTDTLKEEKKRGISINLGFTYFDLPSGRRAGIIDVPGHEKFIKNMLAGVGGIDIVLMVIAADEGVMPQTREHLNILELLDIKKGIIVITKKDLVDDEWLKMVEDDIKKEVENTFLKDAPIIPVSSYTGDGIKALTEIIDKETSDVEERDLYTDFRVPVDRVFTVSGFGTVVTGTLISGCINEGDACEIYTKEIETRIRGIQVHETPVKTAYAGQRVALNLASVKTSDIERGDVVSKAGSMNNSLMLDCRLRYLKDAEKPLTQRERIRLYHGTSEILARVVMLDNDMLKPGETSLVQFRLEAPIAARRGDKYVIRTYSPMHTIGGGTIIEPNPKRHKAHDKKVIDELLVRENGDPLDIVDETVKKNSRIFPSKEDIIRLSGKGISNLDDILKELINSGKITSISAGDETIYIHRSYIDDVKDKSKMLLQEFHRKNSLKHGMQKEEYKIKIFGKTIKQKVFDEILKILGKDLISFDLNLVWLKDFKVVFNKKQDLLKDEIYKIYEHARFQPARPDDVINKFSKDEADAKAVFTVLVNMKMLIKINDEIYITEKNLETAKENLISYIKKNNQITAGEFRDLIGASRKYAVPILEYFDSIKLTKRIEDKRILL